MSPNNAAVVTSRKRLRILTFLIALLVTVPLLGLGFMMVQNAFSQASDSAPYNVVVSGITKSSATIQWSTDQENQSVIEYGTSPTELSFFAPEISADTEHEVELTLLTPATTYYFQIKTGDTVHDNGGVPWTFTTKTTTGEEVQGVSDFNSSADEIGTFPTGSISKTQTINCSISDCNQIRSLLGKGCSSTDYIRCISTNGPTPTGSVLSSNTGSTNNTSTSTTKTPSPTPDITNSECQIKYLQLVQQSNLSCMSWTWDSFATKNPNCRSAFDRYIVQCSSKNFTSTNTQDVAIWYYNNAITNMTTNSVDLTTQPNNNSKVYCQVRAEDSKGNATNWVQASASCSFTPTPTP